MKPHLIKTEAEYQEALDHVYALMDAEADTPEADELELWSLLVEHYEEIHYPIGLPDPIEAIKFRMDQMNLSQADMRPYLGSASKVSEVLNGKRPLSLTMMRKLHAGLGIPLDILVQEPKPADPAVAYDWRDYPFAELLKRGYLGAFNGSLKEARAQAAELLGGLLRVLPRDRPAPVYCRRSAAAHAARERRVSEEPGAYQVGDPAGATHSSAEAHALAAWQARAQHLAAAEELPPFDPACLGADLAAQLARLSYFDDGPRLARELLNKKGIHLITLAHLPGTRLDGACLATPAGRPLIGLTLRHDRLGAFWFTLLHELGHACQHMHWRAPVGQGGYMDETDGGAQACDNDVEAAADAFARDALIPPEAWARAREGLTTTDAIRVFADQLGVSPAVVAGRLRWESGEWTRFGELVGRGKVRRCLEGRPPQA